MPFRFLISLAAAASAALAQSAPNLTLESRETDGNYKLVVRNDYTAPVEAYRVLAAYDDYSGHMRGRGPSFSADSLTAGKASPLGVNASVERPLSEKPVSLRSAVIYSDGTVAGDLGLLLSILDARRSFREAISATLDKVRHLAAPFQTVSDVISALPADLKLVGVSPDLGAYVASMGVSSRYRAELRTVAENAPDAPVHDALNQVERRMRDLERALQTGSGPR